MLSACLGRIFDQIARHVSDIAASRPDLLAPDPVPLAVLSQLASGGDQLAAREALSRGYALRAVLPFPRAVFEQDFSEDERAEFSSLLERADSWHLPGTRDEADMAYAMAGEATVAQSELLIAIWDGETARGLGGTGDVIDYAVRRGVPVIHVPADGKCEPTLLWAGLEQLPSTLLHKHNVPRRPASELTMAAMLSALLLPPADVLERAFLARYLSERPRRLRTRPEFPLLLALTGVRRLRRNSFLVADYASGKSAEWSYFKTGPVAIEPDAQAGLEKLERAFVWADGLADHFAHIYRSGGVFNFLAAAASVLIALIGILAPGQKPLLVATELILIGGLIANTTIGNRQQWHRRWLDYRFLAEQLRTMRSLKLLSVARPVLDAAASAREGRWTDFYAAALWRQMGTPPTIANEAALHGLAEHIAAYEIEDQIAYHRTNAHRMHALDHRLHLFGTTLFYATVLVGVVGLAGLLLGVDAIEHHAKLLTVLSAALPTIGAAVFGIRGQGDFAGAAGRSSRTAARLERVAINLRRQPLTLSDAARTLEDATSTMLDDLGEWNAAYRHRTLAIPS